MELLDHPAAQPLLADADLSADTVRSCAGAVEAFLGRYLPRFYRQEHRDHVRTVLRGKLSGLQRNTTEPIAAQAGQERRPLQLFVGAAGLQKLIETQGRKAESASWHLVTFEGQMTTNPKPLAEVRLRAEVRKLCWMLLGPPPDHPEYQLMKAAAPLPRAWDGIQAEPQPKPKTRKKKAG
jgi:hypothetical protein